MNRLKIWIVIFVVLSGVAFFLIYNTTNSTIKKDLREFAYKDTAQIQEFFLSNKKGQNTKLTRSGDKWLINDSLQARKDLINVLLATVKNIEVLAPVSKAAHNNVVKSLASIGTKIEIYAKVYFIDFWGIKLFSYTKKVRTYYVGQATQDLIGSYMILEGSKTPFITYYPGIRGNVTPRYTADPRDWRDRVVFEYLLDNIREIRNEVGDNKDLGFSNSESFIIKRVGPKTFSLTDLSGNKPAFAVDTLKILDYVSSFFKLNFEEFVHEEIMKPNEKDSILKSTPYRTISITDKSGNTKKAVCYLKSNPYSADEDPFTAEGKPNKYDYDRLYALINGGKDFVFVQYFAFDGVFKKLSDFSMQTLAPQAQNKGVK